ncbi:MAG: hypothetical protein EOO45_14030 [Flavobacterium sp.]|nr:MAG: hypothetical protein EOO45_14030 [Flavobacterium sp.]
MNELYDKLIAEGCNRFCIEGIGGQKFDDIERLEMNNGKWEVRYYERGQAGDKLFSSEGKQEAIQFYHDYVMKIQHRHLVAFTRSFDMLSSYKFTLESHGIKTIQNDVTSYSSANDRVYRLLVVNKDIFRAKELFEKLPYVDEDIKAIW